MASQMPIVRMLAPPRADCVVQVVLAHQCFADDVAVCEGACRVGEEVGEVEGFVGEDLQEGVAGVGELGEAGDGGVLGEVGGEGGLD